jgi:hypothetical protein
MSKQLSKEEMRAYQKSRRDKLKECKAIARPVCKARVLDVKPDVKPVKPCDGCKALEIELKKVRAENSLLKLEIEKRVHAAVVFDATSPGESQSPRRSVDAVGGDGCKVTVSHLSRNDDPPYPLSRLKPLGSNYKPNSLYGA